jgi:Protein of unknown function (DUF3047)
MQPSRLPGSVPSCSTAWGITMARLLLRCVWCGICPLVILLAPTLLAASQVLETDPTLAAMGWRHSGYGDERPNRFALAEDGSVLVETDRSVSSLSRVLHGVNLAATPVLRWRWRVDEPVPPTDLTKREAADRALAVFVTFPYMSEQMTFVERLARPIVEARLGPDAPGRALLYTWGGDVERGEVLEHPHLRSAGVMKVLRPAHAPTQVWFEERVNVRDDYRRAFGAEPPAPLGLILSADSDSTGTRSRALIRGIEFVAQ